MKPITITLTDEHLDLFIYQTTPPEVADAIANGKLSKEDHAANYINDFIFDRINRNKLAVLRSQLEQTYKDAEISLKEIAPKIEIAEAESLSKP